MTNWLVDDPEDRHLAEAPLSLVVCQVRHQREVAVSAASRALQIQKDLGWESELSENLGQELSLNMLDGSTLHSASHNTTTGWRYTSPDGAWTAAIMPDFFSLETRKYDGWNNFQDRLARLTSAIAKHINPEIENRVGLRFVNEITRPQVTSPAGWKGLIDSRLLQSDLLDELSEMLRAAMQVIEIRTSGNQSLVIRHGTQKNPSTNYWQYVIDIDCSRQGAREFVPSGVDETCASLHKVALQAFEMATTIDLRKQMEGSRDDDSLTHPG